MTLITTTGRVLAASALLATSACVSQGRYDTLMQSHQELTRKHAELADEKGALQQRLSKVSEQKQGLESELAAREDKLSKMEQTYDGLVSELRSELQSGKVQIEQLANGIRVNVEDDILFPSGSAELDDRGHELLVRVAEQIRATGHLIEVEGHTDNVPIRSTLQSRFPTNWELAAARATRVVRLLQDQGLPGTQLRAVSHGEFKPVASNEEDAGRAQNRRIGVRLIPVEAARSALGAPTQHAQSDTAPADASAEGAAAPTGDTPAEATTETNSEADANESAETADAPENPPVSAEPAAAPAAAHDATE